MRKDFIGLLAVLTFIGAFVLLYPAVSPARPEPAPPAPTPSEAARYLAEAQSRRPDPTSVKPIGEQRRREVEAPDPTDILLAPETGIGLGWGWNEFHGEAIPTQCVEFVRAQPFDGQTSTLDFSEVNDTYELQAAMEMSASGSVKTMAYEVQGEAKFSAETSVNSSALTYLIEAEVLNAPWVAQPPGDEGGKSVRLTESAARLAERDLELFKDVCGTGYISSTYGGAKLSIVVEITTFSQSTRAAMSSSVSGGGWGVKVSAAMSGSAESGTEKATREIHFFQSGGKPETLPTTPEAIIEAAESLADQADKAEKIYRIAVTPYEVLRNWPREEKLSGSDLEYEELAALWGSYRALYETLQDALETPEAYVMPFRICGDAGCRVEFLPAATANVESEIAALQDEVIIWLDRLELAARTCITAEELCETNAALYRSPYVYQVSAPVRTCMFDQDFTDVEKAAYDAERREVYQALYGDPVRTKDDGDPAPSDRPYLEDFFPDIELSCPAPEPTEVTVASADADTPVAEVGRISGSAVDVYAMMMIEETAKSRCALSSLTPGCLDNADIAAWGDRIGQHAIILTGEDKVQAVIAAVGTSLDQSAADWPAACTGLEDTMNWNIGDPGTKLTTSVWVPPACVDKVRAIALELDPLEPVPVQ